MFSIANELRTLSKWKLYYIVGIYFHIRLLDCTKCFCLNVLQLKQKNLFVDVADVD